MSLKSFCKRGTKGFTLVELLIVVAIIGVLATVGVPTFRRMIQKSKKAEAKVNLAGVYTTESAFSAEYNSFGNNLGKMGFQMEGDPAGLTYTVGFFQDSCANSGTIYPNTGANFAPINAAYPAYYSTVNLATRAGYNGSNNCSISGVTADSAADGTTFLAVASGVVAPGINRTAPTDAQLDVWTMNNGRTLSNVQDGVQ